MKTIQYFTDEYLEQCISATPEQILSFLENYRLLHGTEDKSKLISMKVPESLLSAFRHKCEIHGIKYQTQIKQLMKHWLGHHES